MNLLCTHCTTTTPSTIISNYFKSQEFMQFQWVSKDRRTSKMFSSFSNYSVSGNNAMILGVFCELYVLNQKKKLYNFSIPRILKKTEFLALEKRDRNLRQLRRYK